jgi:phosphonoacetaldehyde hydrolase
VDDTLPGIYEGLNAGMVTVGVAASGNELGLDEAELAALQATPAGAVEVARRLEGAYERFYGAGAHFVVDSVAQLPAVVRHIQARGVPSVGKQLV